MAGVIATVSLRLLNLLFQQILRLVSLIEAHSVHQRY